MTSKHTPGPWIPVAVEGGWDGVAENENRNSVICALRLNNPANARLIAAAPDLLRVAELLVSWLDEEPGAHKLCDAARAAVAKATGAA